MVNELKYPTNKNLNSDIYFPMKYDLQNAMDPNNP